MSSDLIPATPTEFRNELTACLALTAPVGMSEEARGEWLAVAWQTLKHLPPDLLKSGAQKAREQCDHPAKIVPTIIRETQEWLGTRRRIAAYAKPGPEALPAPGGERCTADDVSELLNELRSAQPNTTREG